MPGIKDSRGPGRPKSQAKRNAILNAARDLLLEHGYRETSMEMVAAAAGVGKPTVYSHFGSKEELWEAIIAARRRTVLEKIGTLKAPTEDPRADLEQFALQFQNTLLHPSSRQWDRLVIAEAGRHPEMARAMFKAGPAKIYSMIQSYLETQHEAGRLTVEDSALAAEHLIGMLTGFELLRGHLASQPKRTQKEKIARAKAAITAFLAAYGPERRRNKP
jgi:TetR/AcrR family transcriptional repressor of mexJK operon